MGGLSPRVLHLVTGEGIDPGSLPGEVVVLRDGKGREPPDDAAVYGEGGMDAERLLDLIIESELVIVW